MAVRLTASGVEYDQGFGTPSNILQSSTARIKVLATFNFTPFPNAQYGGTTPYDTGVPVTAQVRKNLRLGFRRISGGISATNNAAVTNQAYWGFTLGNGNYGNEPTFTYVNGVQTSSTIKLRFWFRSINVTSVSAIYTVKLYTYG